MYKGKATSSSRKSYNAGTAAGNNDVRNTNKKLESESNTSFKVIRRSSRKLLVKTSRQLKSENNNPANGTDDKNVVNIEIVKKKSKPEVPSDESSSQEEAEKNKDSSDQDTIEEYTINFLNKDENKKGDSPDELDDIEVIALTKWMQQKNENKKTDGKESDQKDSPDDSSDMNLLHNADEKSEKKARTVGGSSDEDYITMTKYNTSKTLKTSKSDNEDDKSKNGCTLPALTALKVPNNIEKLKRKLMCKLLENCRSCKRRDKWSILADPCCKQPPPPKLVQHEGQGCVIQQILHFNEYEADTCYSDTSEDDDANISCTLNYYNNCCSSNCAPKPRHNGCNTMHNSCSSYGFGGNNYCGQNCSSQMSMPMCYQNYNNNPYCYYNGCCYPQYDNMFCNTYALPMSMTNCCPQNTCGFRKSKSRSKAGKCSIIPTFNEPTCNKAQTCSFSSHTAVNPCNILDHNIENSCFAQPSNDSFCVKCNVIPSNTSERVCYTRSDKIQLLPSSNSYLSIKTEVDKKENSVINIDETV